MTRPEAFAVLLSRPDPPDLPPRGYRYTLGRKPLRDPEAIKRDLGTAYVTWRRQEHTDGDVSCVVAVRRARRLRVVNG